MKVLRERYRNRASLVDFNDEELVASWQRQVIQCIIDLKKGRARVFICALTLDLTDCWAMMDKDLEALGTIVLFLILLY